MYTSVESSYYTHVATDTSMLKKAVEHIIKDDSFHLPLEPAATALRIAKAVIRWSSQEENKLLYYSFEKKIIEYLQTCLPNGCQNRRSFQTQKVDLWRAYHQVRTSDTFNALWSDFLQQVTSEPPVPTFYQEVTDLMFECMVQAAFPVERESEASSADPITYSDANVIRYAAGYVARKVKEKICKSALPNKPALIKCLMGLLEEEEEEASPSADWLNLVDRGGLWRVREGTYMLFCAMEDELRQHLQKRRVQEMTEGFKDGVCRAISDNEEVLFHWCMLTCDVDDEIADVVLTRLINLWITIRGFSFTNGWLEHYKQSRKKTLQRSKALRKDIRSSQ